MRTRRQKNPVPTAFHFSNWRTGRYVTAQGFLRKTAVSVPQHYLTDIRNESRSHSEWFIWLLDNTDCACVVTRLWFGAAICTWIQFQNLTMKCDEQSDAAKKKMSRWAFGENSLHAGNITISYAATCILYFHIQQRVLIIELVFGHLGGIFNKL